MADREFRHLDPSLVEISLQPSNTEQRPHVGWTLDTRSGETKIIDDAEHEQRIVPVYVMAGPDPVDASERFTAFVFMLKLRNVVTDEVEEFNIACEAVDVKALAETCTNIVELYESGAFDARGGMTGRTN